MALPTKKQVKAVRVEKPVLFAFTYKIKCVILCGLCFLFYANSIPDKYALDDSITIEQNAYVKMGFSGIPKILSSDALASFFTQQGDSAAKQEATGGRYRPLSEVFFAIEQQFFGDSEMLPHIRHFINIIGYMACVLAIFYFLENFLFRKISSGSDMAFIAAFLFAIHPIHTEVVDNIKSFDEILSMFFIMLTFINSLKYLQDKKIKYLVFGAGSYFLALLSKEYAVTLLFFIPFLFYLLEDKKIIPAIRAGIPYYSVFAGYLLLRYVTVGFHQGVPSSDIITNPYLYATHVQRIATEWFVLGKYIALLLYPYPLSSDYSCSAITYHNFSNISVLLSTISYIVLSVWGIVLAFKRSILSFAVFFFLINILIISNFVIDIGGAMGQRLLFHSSIAVAIIFSYYVVKWTSQQGPLAAKKTMQIKKGVAIGILSILTVMCFGETIIRNPQWKDDDTLFIHEAFVIPNSYLINNNAAWVYLSYSEEQGNTVAQAKAYLDSAYKYSQKALHIKPKYDAGYLNLGAVYYHWALSGEKPWGIDSAKYCWEMVQKINPNHPSLSERYALLTKYYFQKGIEIGQNNPVESIRYMRQALLHDSSNADIWYNIGGAYFTMREYDSAKYAWIKTLQYKPDNADAKSGLAALASVKKN
jgi:protein O-mannosyl-transferase